MSKLINRFRRLSKDDSGASLIEYSILIGLITVAVIMIISGVGDWVVSQWNGLNTNLPAN